MTLVSRLLSLAAKLPPAVYRDIRVDRDIGITMSDGAVLRADRWWAPSADSPPVVLIRSPYGRGAFALLGRLFAERGFQVVVESCRGTEDSDGEFCPFRNEADDGFDTLEWIAGQGWFAGSVAMFGPSYLGISQWAAVDHEPPSSLDALALQATNSEPRAVVFPGGSFALETGAFWLDLLLSVRKNPGQRLIAFVTSRKRFKRAYSHLPLGDADVVGLGVAVPFYRDWLDHEGREDRWWDRADFTAAARRFPPCTQVAGWYDLFLVGQLEDYSRLVEAGREVRLTIGPWTHLSPRLAGEGLRDAIDFFTERLVDKHPGGPGRSSRGAVRLQITGSDRWVVLPHWPPESITGSWYLGPGSTLLQSPPGVEHVDSYVYDPADPTPSRGGPSLNPARAGERDQRRRERRGDVLVYTTEPLAEPLTVVGYGSIRLWIRSSRPDFDLFVRLCDVDRRGRSTNVCDGLRRFGGEDVTVDSDGVIEVEIPLWPTAREFRKGHRIRVQVSSGAHPLYSRNTGSGGSLRSSERLVPSYHELFRSAERPSSLELPVAGR